MDDVIAIHEASHVVMATALGLPVRSVPILERKLDATRYTLTDARAWLEAWDGPC